MSFIIEQLRFGLVKLSIVQRQKSPGRISDCPRSNSDQSLSEDKFQTGILSSGTLILSLFRVSPVKYTYTSKTDIQSESKEVLLSKFSCAMNWTKKMLKQ